MALARKLEEMGPGEVARVVRGGIAETPAHAALPLGHWKRIRANSAVGRPDREIRGRTRVVGTFPDGRSAPMLVAARLKYVADGEWGSRRYLDVSLLDE
jgi:transposase-like protein